MALVTDIVLDQHDNDFVITQIHQGEFNTPNDVVKAGLALLETQQADKGKLERLKQKLQEGIDSGICHDFDPIAHLQSLKAQVAVHA